MTPEDIQNLRKLWKRIRVEQRRKIFEKLGLSHTDQERELLDKQHVAAVRAENYDRAQAALRGEHVRKQQGAWDLITQFPNVWSKVQAQGLVDDLVAELIGRQLENVGKDSRFTFFVDGVEHSFKNFDPNTEEQLAKGQFTIPGEALQGLTSGPHHFSLVEKVAGTTMEFWAQIKDEVLTGQYDEIRVSDVDRTVNIDDSDEVV